MCYAGSLPSQLPARRRYLLAPLRSLCAINHRLVIMTNRLKWAVVCVVDAQAPTTEKRARNHVRGTDKRSR